MEKNLKRLGVFGIISLLSYTAMVVFSPLAYPGYDWLSMAVSDLCAEGAPSEALASQLNALFGPCALVSVMAVCVGITAVRSGHSSWEYTVLPQWNGYAMSDMKCFHG